MKTLQLPLAPYPRHFDVLRLLAQRLTRREIARELKIAESTVTNYLVAAKNRLRVADMKELRRVAVEWESGRLAIVAPIPRAARNCSAGHAPAGSRGD